MRRQLRTLLWLSILVVLAGLILGFQNIRIGDFFRGGDTPLGLSLGLDLQGGSHLIYQAALTDPETGEKIEVTEEQMLAVRRTIERRINASGLGEPILQIIGTDRLLVQLPGVEDTERARALIGETASLEFKHRRTGVLKAIPEITSEDFVSITVAPTSEVFPPAEDTPSTTGGAQETPPEGETSEEPNNSPVLVVEFTPEGANKFITVMIELNTPTFTGGGGDIQSIPLFNRLEISLEGGEPLRFDIPGPAVTPLDAENTFAFPYPQQIAGDQGSGSVIDLATAQGMLGESPTIVFTQITAITDEDIGLTGEDLARAYPSQHSTTGRPIVNLEFNEEGTRIFGELTTAIAGTSDQIAIFLDGEELIAPVVQTPITTGTAIIQGQNFTLARVQDVALLLESGRLPIPIELLQERDVDAILGADSLSKSVVAGAVGLSMILLFMSLYYRLPGVLASLALIFYASLVLAIFKILPVTLTLSGIAAAILSVGMAVDANILIFERMKDELRSGRTLMTSINTGFNRAWPAIRDSNVSTLITCAILFWFADQLGTTIVQGFAATLAIGVILSMFTAIVVSRTLLRLVASTRLSRKLTWFVPSGGSSLPQLQSPVTATQRS